MTRSTRLFTPGPLTTSATVKLAMQRDIGSRDEEFVAIVRDIRRRLLEVANAPADAYTSILLPGSGTFGVESVLGSVVPGGGRVLVLVNGAYGRRMVEMTRVLRIPATVLECDEDRTPSVIEVDAALQADRSITHVAIVHVETTTGIANPAEDIGRVVHAQRRVFILDSMSALGGVSFDVCKARVDFLVSSANKCIEGVPGFSFVIARKAALDACAGVARSHSLDLHAQAAALDGTGQFRFTPPTHVVLAFQQALRELEEEGGVEARSSRYRRNREVLLAGMRDLGFEEVLRPPDQTAIITAFRMPADPRFRFEDFYVRLRDKGFVIYPGKLSTTPSFRIGTIGRIDAGDVRSLLAATRETLEEMGVVLPRRTMHGTRAD